MAQGEGKLFFFNGSWVLRKPKHFHQFCLSLQQGGFFLQNPSFLINPRVWVRPFWVSGRLFHVDLAQLLKLHLLKMWSSLICWNAWIGLGAEANAVIHAGLWELFPCSPSHPIISRHWGMSWMLREIHGVLGCHGNGLLEQSASVTWRMKCPQNQELRGISESA